MDVLEAQLLQDPTLHQHMQAIEQHNDQYHQHLSQQVGFRNVITIPVVFHVIHNGDAVGSNENLAEAFILAQLAQLNDDFRKMNADAPSVPPLFQGLHADTEIQFCLAQRRPDGTPTNGINRVQFSQASWTTTQINSTVKPATIWDRNQYLNVWTVVFGGTSSGVLGFAQFPGGAANTDGVVVAWNTVGSLALPHPNGGNYARGRTLSHEVGHWLNLRHIWGDATCGNDFVADTPVHQTSNSGCPTFPKTNNCSGGPWTEMTMNYMDYTFDVCMYMFTEGQKTRMRAVLAQGGARFSLNNSLGCVPPGETCTAPTLAQLSASNITTSSARLNCTVSGVNAYDWRYRVAGATTWTDIASTTANFADISGLAAATTYEFQAMVQCGAVWSAWSPTQTFTTLAAPSCNAPQLSQLFLTNVTQTSARLNCSATGVNAYDWRYRQVGAAVWIDLPSTTVAFTDISGLAASTAYEFQVMVQCGTVWSAWSPALQFNTAAPANCDPPNLIQYSVTEITSTSARFNCTVAGVSAYLWRYRRVGTIDWIDLPSTTVNFIYVTNLQPQTDYEMQVALVCQGAQSLWTKSLGFTTLPGDATCTAPAPGQLSASNITENAATLNCSLTGVSAYYWRYRQQGTSSWVDLGSTPGGSFPLSGLLPATTYEYQVAVMCNSGQSDWSLTQTFTTLAPAVCSAPGANQLSASAITSTSAQLNCSVGGASLYFWRYRPAGAGLWTNIPPTSANFTVVSGLAPATDYEFQVSVQCVNGATSDWSASQVFSTTQTACDPPLSNQIFTTNITLSSARLNCSIGGVDAYQWRYRLSGASAWIDLGATTANFYDLTGLSVATTYEFQVAVQCGSTWSPWSATGIFTTAAPTPCNPPTSRNLMVFFITSSSAQLICTFPADQYLWRYRPVGSSDWTTAGPTTQGIIDISGLQAATNYEFQVSVFCGSTQSVWSDSRVFTTLGGTRSEGLSIQLFPVPAKDQLHVQLQIPENAEVSMVLTDMTGRTVSVERWGRAEPGLYVRSVDISTLPSGIYVMNLRAGENICREIFIIAAE